MRLTVDDFNHKKFPVVPEGLDAEEVYVYLEIVKEDFEEMACENIFLKLYLFLDNVKKAMDGTLKEIALFKTNIRNNKIQIDEVNEVEELIIGTKNGAEAVMSRIRSKFYKA